MAREQQLIPNLIARLPFTIKERKNWFVSSCPILDVHSQGYTRNEAIENLIEALSLFFSTCIEMGTLDKVLRECGFVYAKIEKNYTDEVRNNYIEVPIPLVYKKQPNEIECHA